MGGSMLAQIRESLAETRAADTEEEKGLWASVACILRGGQDASGPLEMLFVLRANSERDRWSGQIAFPGGKWDERDATMLDTAVRETQEEIGWDLRTRRTEYLGRSQDVSAGDRKAVSCYIFHIGGPPSSITLSLNASEIAAVLWVPISRILDPSNEVAFTVPIAGSVPASQLYFRACQLVPSECQPQDTPQERLVLWGLTLWLAVYLLRNAGQPADFLTAAPRYWTSRQDAKL
ncbi:hypothetical protein DIPPA_02005 [Diplonema papillatum]|nr:hypothetical protein DIPPA_02005 [Diplonema papillatum]